MIGAWALRDWLRPKISSSTEHTVQPLQINPLEGGGGHLSCERAYVQGSGEGSGDTATSALCDMRCNEWQ
jgi:hypothetical protein